VRARVPERRPGIEDRLPRARLPAYLFLAWVMALAYWVALAISVRPLEFVLGASLAFYVPGAVLVHLNPGFFRRTAWIEQVAASFILSVAFTAMSAFALDFTPLGITQRTLAAAITALVMGATLSEVVRGGGLLSFREAGRADATADGRAVGRRSQGDWGEKRQFALALASVMLLAAAWVVVMPMAGSIADRIDRSVTPRSSPGYTEFTASCILLPDGQGSALEFTVTDRGDPYNRYELSIGTDKGQRTSVALPRVSGSLSVRRYRVRLPGRWHDLTARLDRRAGTGLKRGPLRTTMSAEVCRRG